MIDHTTSSADQHQEHAGRPVAIRITEGMPVVSGDHVVGEVADVVIDPVRRRLTHLVVQPGHRHDMAHLIPIDAVASADDQLKLSWSADQVQSAPLVEETEFIDLERWPHPDNGWNIGTSRVLAWPYYGAGGIGLDMGFEWGYGRTPATTITTYDRIPSGTTEIRRTSEVVSSDDHVVGHVDGFIVDPADGITHIVLERGHLWGHREITIPMREVRSVVYDRVHLRSTRDEIGELPTAAFHRHPSSAAEQSGDRQADKHDVSPTSSPLS
jgi:uncharacterized protein YrrD